MKNTIRYLLSLIIAMLLCIIIAPCAFAEDTVYTTSDVAGGVRIDSVATTETKLVIPDEIGGKVVVALGAKAFAGTSVEEITVPAGVTSMYSYSESALFGMENLKKVTFAEGMRTVPYNALLNCSTVTEVILPESLTAISGSAFYGCAALTTINLPDSITSIEGAAFCNCTSLTKIKLPEKLTTLGEGAFAKCTKIKEITLPDSLKTIGCLAFYKTQISEITIPASIEKMYSHGSVGNIDGIYSNDFSSLSYMEYLTKVTFADGMTTVPANALLDCAYIEEVVIYDCNESLEAMKTAAEEGDYELTVLPCSECNHRITEIRNTIEVTCSTNGYTGDTYCNDCGELITKGETVAATGHTEEIIPAVPATYTSTGLTEGKKCSVCDEILVAQTEIPILEMPNLTPKTENITVTDTIAASAPEMSVETFIASVENEIVQILDKDGNILSTYEVMVKADVDGNGKITPADARLALRAAVGIDTISDVYATAANYDEKETISTSDARMILRKAVGLE